MLFFNHLYCKIMIPREIQLRIDEKVNDFEKQHSTDKYYIANPESLKSMVNVYRKGLTEKAEEQQAQLEKMSNRGKRK